MQHAPATFEHFAQYLRLERRDARRLWTALSHSQAPAAVGLRQSFALHDALPLDSKGLAHRQCRPSAAVQVIEGLVNEGLLTRRDATRIVEAILTCTDRDGHWRQRALAESPAGGHGSAVAQPVVVR